MTASLDLKVEDGLATLSLNNPRRLNAFTPEMLDMLDRHCASLDTDPAVHCVILRGEGERAFCAGADIKAWSVLPPFDFARDWVRGGHRIFDRLARLSKPSIAVIHAHAFGGGLELAVCCDIRVMAPDATLALPEAQIGIVPGWSGTQRLARLIPVPVLKEMAIFGRRIDAQRALSLGLVAEISDDPLSAARSIAAKLQDASPRAAEVAKYMIHAATGEDRDAMIEALGSGMIAASDDKAEGVAAFAEKRKPAFPGT
ncbi:enoyl-CoA hydratase/isomerase family protein [Paracoccus aerodenitrificans]|uniref:enoyl-CoA hydratase/isomerase family protein n=1 Tax=Paracoccus aerodenitrificans TaxID=3017781 RepID=UPI0022F07B56|nr:enoyl-CoA hydratase/isomerase family protein [Paracoccus aerodenitrificans]WBU65291.1 enoyl-CoA hydratase/isomerase family protein [Paracoccus aerodenitrificans]